MIRLTFLSCLLAAAASFDGRVNATDTIELDNGDTIQAKVVQMSDETLKVKHEILGEVSIPRKRIRAIVFGLAGPPANDPTPTRSQPLDRELGGPDGEPRQETPKEIIDRLVNKDFGPKAVQKLERGAVRQDTPEAVVEQLRIEGVDPRIRSSLHLMLPGFGTPEVQGYFDSRVNGLMDGSMTIQDIRKDAIGARDQLKEIMDDLGADGAALQGYFSILDNFIKKTAPSKQPPE